MRYNSLVHWWDLIIFGILELMVEMGERRTTALPTMDRGTPIAIGLMMLMPREWGIIYPWGLAKLLSQAGIQVKQYIRASPLPPPKYSNGMIGTLTPG